MKGFEIAKDLQAYSEVCQISKKTSKIFKKIVKD